jgi:glycosyltransferase involved in cell wall biosynthesis
VSGGAPPELSVVLPAHNEALLIEPVIGTLLSELEHGEHRFELVLVENGSTDETLVLAAKLAEQHHELQVLHLERPDYGAALAAGFEAARGAIVVAFDVDYYDLAFLDAALALLGQPETPISPPVALVLASKRAPGSLDHRPLLRRILTLGFTALLRSGFGLTVSDAHGMKAFRAETILPLVRQCELRGGLFDVELVLRAQRAGVRIAELPAEVTEIRPARTTVSSRTVETLRGLWHLRQSLTRLER